MTKEKLTKEQLDKISDEMISDESIDSWDERKLGADEKHARVVSVRTSIRLPADLVAALKELSADNGLPYQTYIKQVLFKHVKKKAS